MDVPSSSRTHYRPAQKFFSKYGGVPYRRERGLLQAADPMDKLGVG